MMTAYECIVNAYKSIQVMINAGACIVIMITAYECTWMIKMITSCIHLKPVSQ